MKRHLNGEPHHVGVRNPRSTNFMAAPKSPRPFAGSTACSAYKWYSLLHSYCTTWSRHGDWTSDEECGFILHRSRLPQQVREEEKAPFCARVRCMQALFWLDAKTFFLPSCKPKARHASSSALLTPSQASKSSSIRDGRFKASLVFHWLFSRASDSKNRMAQLVAYSSRDGTVHLVVRMKAECHMQTPRFAQGPSRRSANNAATQSGIISVRDPDHEQGAENHCIRASKTDRNIVHNVEKRRTSDTDLAEPYGSPTSDCAAQEH